ncbi:MAG: ribbon-helix-helix domain-containing protein [Nitrococcus sp.]|nr:ribbon-helix-helix domain-containing protein [Nitrococcus sp.]
MKLTKTTLYLPEADHRRVKALARQRNQPTAELLREAIAEYALRHDGRPVPRSVGIGHSGQGDLAERAEELLEGMGHDS